MKHTSLLVFIVALSLACSSNNATDGGSTIEIQKLALIELNGDSNYFSNLEIINWNENESAIVGIDKRQNELLFFDLDGELLNEIQVPSSGQPFGLRRIADIHYINKDSILIYDSILMKVLLQNMKSEVVDSWSLTSFWKEASRGANVGIVDAYSENGELMVELLAFENEYSISSEDYYSNTRLFHHINLTKQKVTSYMGYPTESPYREQLFYSAYFPYVVKTDNSYVLSFPFDKNLYLYTQDLKTYSYLENSPAGFPRATGQPFGSSQTKDVALYTRKLNGFGLNMKSVVAVEGVGEAVIRVYREALGENYDVDSNSVSELPVTFNLELFAIGGGEIRKVAHQNAINELALGNFIGQDKKGAFYFLEHNEEVEDRRVYKVRLSIK